MNKIMFGTGRNNNDKYDDVLENVDCNYETFVY